MDGCVGRQRGQWVCGYYWIEASVSTVCLTGTIGGLACKETATVGNVPARRGVWVDVWVDRGCVDRGECVNCVSHRNYKDSGVQRRLPRWITYPHGGVYGWMCG